MHFNARFARVIIRDVLTFHRSATELGSMFRCTLGVLAALMLGHLSGRAAAAPLMALGAFICGFISLEGVYRSRVRLIVATACGIAASSFIGELSLGSLPLLLGLTAAVGYINGVFAQLSRLAGAVALYTSVTFIVFSHHPLSLEASVIQSTLLLCGAVVQVALLVLCYPLSRFTLERRVLAAAFTELGNFADASTGDYLKAPPAAKLIIAGQVLADPQPFARARDVARLRRMLRDMHVLRSRLAGLHALHNSPSPVEAAAQASFLCACAAQLHEIARMISGARQQDDAAASDSALRQSFETFESAFVSNAIALQIAGSTIVHLRDAFQGASVIATGKFSRFLFVASPRPGQYIETRVDWRSRDAIRLAAVLFIAMLLGHTLFTGGRGYWIALTVVLVLKPDMRSTFARGVSRIGGTVIGAVAVMQLLLLYPSHAWLEAGMVVSGAICYATFFANYGIFTLAVTAYVIFFLSSIGFPASSSIEARVLDTLIGGGLAIVGYLALPSWAHKRARTVLAELVQTQARFADAMLHEYLQPAAAPRDELERLRTRAWKLRIDAEALVDRVRDEPNHVYSIRADRALELLAATQSFALVNLAIESGIDSNGAITQSDLFGRFRSALAAEMELLSAAIDSGTAPRSNADFLNIGEEIEAYSDPGNTTQRFLQLHCTGYVQNAAELRKLCA